MKTLSVHDFQQHWVELKSRYSSLCRGRLFIGLSGGLDSIVLSHLLSRTLSATEQSRLCILHVHHGLQQQADDWAHFCATFAGKVGLEYRVLAVDASPTGGQSPEEAARDARYEAFSSVLGADEALLTAHHQDDQAETFLLQLMRGAGLAGLSSMPECRSLGKGHLLRPLLPWSRSQLASYASEHTLKWVDDPSNLDTHYDRNFIRQQVLPLLQARWPAATRVIQRSAGHCASAQVRLEAIMQEELNEVTLSSGTNRLTLLPLLKRPEEEVIPLLLSWCRREGVDLPSQAQLKRIYSDVIHAAEDRQPRVEWGDVSLRRYQQTLYLLPRELPEGLRGCYSWERGKSLHIQGWAHLSANDWPAASGRDELLQLCFRADLPQKGHAKQWLQRHHIPPWQRDRTLFITSEAGILGLIPEPEPLWAPSGRGLAGRMSDQDDETVSSGD